MTKLLRLAYSISVKLNLKDFQKWLYSEMYGYKSVEDLPEYRFIQGIKGVPNIRNSTNFVSYQEESLQCRTLRSASTFFLHKKNFCLTMG